jgi:hypothetical protein
MEEPFGGSNVDYRPRYRAGHSGFADWDIIKCTEEKGFVL